MRERTLKRRLCLLVGFTIALATAGAMHADPTPMEKRLTAFSTDDGLARAVAFDAFDREIPPSERADALASLWDAAAGRKDRDLVRASVLAYLYVRSETQLAWTDSLRAIVKSGAQSEWSDVRQLAMMAIIKRKASQTMRAEMLRALQDREELIRNLAIGEIARWPDYRPILNDYIKRNEGTKAHTETVTRARRLLEKGGIK